MANISSTLSEVTSSARPHLEGLKMILSASGLSAEDGKSNPLYPLKQEFLKVAQASVQIHRIKIAAERGDINEVQKLLKEDLPKG